MKPGLKNGPTRRVKSKNMWACAYLLPVGETRNVLVHAGSVSGSEHQRIGGLGLEEGTKTQLGTPSHRKKKPNSRV